MGERIIVKVNGMSSARMDTSFIDSESSLISLYILCLLYQFLFRTHQKGRHMQRSFATDTAPGITRCSSCAATLYCTCSGKELDI